MQKLLSSQKYGNEAFMRYVIMAAVLKLAL